MYHNLLAYITLILIYYDSSLIFMLPFKFLFSSSFRTCQESKNECSCVANFFFKSAFLFLMLLRHIQKDFRHMVSCFSSSPLGIKHSTSLLYCQSINTIAWDRQHLPVLKHEATIKIFFILAPALPLAW